MRDSILKRVVFCGLLSGLTGCALIHDIWEQDSIAEYGEQVFRKQNLLTSQVMMMSESELSQINYQKLQQAEAQMQKDCKLLNEYAVREMDKTSIDLLFQQQVKESVNDCDLSIQKMEALLANLGIKE